MANWKILLAVLGLISACTGQGGPPPPLGPDPCEREADFVNIPNRMSCTVSENIIEMLKLTLCNFQNFQEYFQCFDGRGFRVSCPYGLYFSPTARRCMSYQEANCRLELPLPTITPPPTTQLPPETLCVDVEDFTLFPSEFSCSVSCQILL